MTWNEQRELLTVVLFNERIGRTAHNKKPVRYLQTQLAIAACLIIAVLGGVYLTLVQVGYPSRSADAPQQWVTLELTKTSEVTLALSANEAITGASLTLDLPDGVELQGYPEQRQLRWVTSLEKGENRLRLPLVASYPPRGDLILKIQHGDKERTLRIGVRSSEKSRSTGLVGFGLSKKAA